MYGGIPYAGAPYAGSGSEPTAEVLELPVLGNIATLFSPQVRTFYPETYPEDPGGSMDPTGILVEQVTPPSLTGTVLEGFDQSWQDALETDGSGTISLDSTTAVEGQTVLRFSLNGEYAFQALVSEISEAEITVEEEYGQVANLRGNGAITMFKDAAVAPDAGIDSQPIADMRYFNFAALELDETGWVPAIHTSRIYNPGPDGRYLRPPAFVDSTADYLWDRDVSTTPPPLGDVYFRQWFTYSGETRLGRLQVASDDEIEVWIDNISMVEMLGGNNGYKSAATTFTLTPGTHLVAWRARNLAPIWAMSAWAIGSVDLNGNFDVVIAHSDSATAICLPYPEEPPGFSVTHAFHVLLAEAQARGEIPYITTSFTDTHDSDGSPVPITNTLSCRVDQSLLDVIRAWGESYWEVAFSPYGYVLDAWLKGQRGTDVPVTWDGGDELVELHRDKVDTPTVAWVRYANGRVEVEHPSVATKGRKVVGLSMGHINNEEQARFEGAAYLDAEHNRSESVALEIDIDESSLSEQVYTGVRVGDSPLVNGERLRVHGISVTLDGDDVRVVPEVVSAALTREQRNWAINNQMNPGSGGGRSRAVSPVDTSISFPPSDPGREIPLIFSWENIEGPVELIVDTGSGPVVIATVNPGAGLQETWAILPPKRIAADSRIIVQVGGVPSPEKRTDEGIWIMEFRVDRDSDPTRGAADVMIAERNQR